MKSLESAADITRQIKALEAELAKVSRELAQTLKGGMQRLETAHKRAAVSKLKNRRTKLD